MLAMLAMLAMLEDGKAARGAGPNPVPKSIGQEAYRKLQQKALTGVVVRSENRVLQLRPELSIIPGQSAAAK
ncbi:MAG: hypothetical protein ACREEM_48165 [Blastocatellia bacterium]